MRFQKISIFHQTLCRKYYKTWRLARNDQMARKRNPGAQALHDSSFIPFFFFVCNCYKNCSCLKLFSYLRFLFFICLFLFFLFAFEPSGPPYHCYQMFCCLTQGVNKFILRVTVSTNKMDVLANSVLRQIVWTIADIKMHADSTLRALKLAVLLFTGTHQLWNFVTAYSVFSKKIPSIVVFDLNCGIWEGQGARMPLMYQVRDVTLPLVNLIRWSNVLPLT